MGEERSRGCASWAGVTRGPAQSAAQVMVVVRLQHSDNLMRIVGHPIKRPFLELHRPGNSPWPYRPSPACLNAISLGAAVITPDGNNGASVTAGCHINRRDFENLQSAGGWTNLLQKEVCPSCRRWWGPLQLRHQIDVSSKGAKEDPKGTRSGTQEGVA